MDQGIIKNFKHMHRKWVIKKVLDMFQIDKHSEITFLDCVTEVQKAQNDVTSKVIFNCFKKARFQKTIEAEETTNALQ